MKKIIYSAFAVFALMAASCNENNQDGNTTNSTAAKDNGELKLAYVLLDTLQNQYEFFKDVNEEMQTKEANAKATLAQKEQAFAAKAQEIQSKASQNAYTQEQYNVEVAKLQKMQQDGQELQARLEQQLVEESSERLKAVSDTIQHFISSYAKDKGYHFIFSKTSGIDHLLFAAPAYDVTDEVVAALNKRYASEKKEDTKKDEEKK